jgi:beta-xylosidase
MPQRTYSNPVYPGYFADPFAFRHEGTYYAVGTGAAEARSEVSGSARVFPVLRSSDLASWEPVGEALVRPDPALGDTFWAPEVLYQDGLFYLYYSVGFGDRRHHLRVAVSEQPAGPYEDSGVSLTNLDECPFAIDPHPFRDHDGKVYLFFARDFLDLTDEQGRAVRAGTALVAYPLESPTRLGSTGRTVLRARADWQRFQADREMYGARYDWHTLEGPAVIRHDGRYYLFYSGGRWENETYGVDYAVADSVLGPYEDDGSDERGARVLRTRDRNFVGPGHNSLVRGPDGKTDYLVYHAWDREMTARRLCIDPIDWTREGPRCHGPSTTPQPLFG